LSAGSRTRRAGLELVSQIVDIYDNYEYDTQIIAAASRSCSTCTRWRESAPTADRARTDLRRLDAIAFTDILQRRSFGRLEATLRTREPSSRHTHGGDDPPSWDP